MEDRYEYLVREEEVQREKGSLFPGDKVGCELGNRLDVYSEDGWELFNSHILSNSCHHITVIFIFRREIKITLND